jgi:hypothetical protein
VQPLGSSQHFMEPEGSLPSSQQLSTCTYPEPDQSSMNTAIVILRIILCPLLNIKSDFSGMEFCLRLQVESTKLGPVDKASLSSGRKQNPISEASCNEQNRLRGIMSRIMQLYKFIRGMR